MVSLTMGCMKENSSFILNVRSIEYFVLKFKITSTLEHHLHPRHDNIKNISAVA